MCFTVKLQRVHIENPADSHAQSLRVHSVLVTQGDTANKAANFMFYKRWC